jgi:hypothetical protein
MKKTRQKLLAQTLRENPEPIFQHWPDADLTKFEGILKKYEPTFSGITMEDKETVIHLWTKYNMPGELEF